VPISNNNNSRPHKRVLLTQPSALEDAAPMPTTGSGSASSDANSSLVRVIAYLTPEEAQQLEMVWLQMRALAIRPSKADIMRAALKLAMDNTEMLSAKLVEQMGGGPPPPANGRKPGPKA